MIVRPQVCLLAVVDYHNGWRQLVALNVGSFLAMSA
jgi:hypothetical protein